MNRHQVLSGACNAGDHCFAVGSVEGVPFTAYAAGCNIVILASTFERVQIIPGANYNYIRISCIDCSTDTGKIAAAYDNQVIIFEPTPLLQNTFSHQLDYRWVQTATLQADSAISSLSWNMEGTRLLTGGEVLQLWHFYPPLSEDDNKVTFEIGEEVSENSPPQAHNFSGEQPVPSWECVWKQKTATPTVHMAFSADGTLFATAGKSDRLVKIWFEQKPLLFPSKSSDGPPAHSINEFTYGFVYIAHPRAVTQLSWRKTSKYMPKGSVANMLITSCRDNICRIWVETVLPDDGLVNMSQFDPLAAQNPKFRTHRHKHRFMQRLKHMKTCFHIRRNAKSHSSSPSMSGPIPTLPSTFSVHDFHNYGFQGTGLTTGLHFHLAASINAETDIPLVPSLITADPDQEPNFILHWLNNKEMHFTLQAENLLHELTKKAEKEEAYDQQDNAGFVDDENAISASSKPKGKLIKGTSQDESNSDEISQGHPHASAHSGGIASHTMSNATSLNSLATETAAPGALPAGDPLDMRIESLLKDWHHGPDLLFSIHPIDGSFLIWVVEWLDEYHAGSFRQAQVSFSTRIPNAFPLGDAMTMSTNISLFNTCQSLALRNLMKPPPPRTIPTSAAGIISSEGLNTVEEQPEGNDDDQEENEEKPTASTENLQEQQNNQDPDLDTSFSDFLNSTPSPVISMVSKHKNGTLNLWQLTFSDKSKFSQVLSISHNSRASGHRFRVNDITCHPVLPLLLTTSHHNIPEVTTPNSNGYDSPQDNQIQDVSVLSGFCSELILWRVDAVGPLSKSGGVSELARINSPEISAFSNVAWIPTLLPSTTLGNLSNSPSACFVASDGQSLRVYQAVIDARTLLAEINSSERRSRMMDSMISISEESSMDDGGKHTSLHNKIKIVSQQSTARPGCVIQLDPISDATHDWQNTQFLHVFQEQLIVGQKTDPVDGILGPDLGLMETQLGAMVDLQQSAVFEEPFYIVVMEKSAKHTLMHMWRLVIASQPDNPEFCGSMMYVPDSQLTQDDGEEDLDHHVGASHANHEPSRTSDQQPEQPPTQTSHVIISTTKVCTQILPLPEDVEVIHAAPAAGHLSSASIYPACFAPYTIVTACSDNAVRFWNCKVTNKKDNTKDYEWCEWEMRRKDKESTVEIAGKPLNISVAYSGRIACAYKYGKSFARPSRKDPNARFVNMCIAIYECESTGGSEWVLEDTIHLKNIYVPYLSEPDLDSSLHSALFKKRSPKTMFDDTLGKPSESAIPSVPSFSTLHTLRKSISEKGNVCPLTQKHLVQLDWVSNEDGSHILTVAVGSTVMLFTPVSSDLAQANMKAMKESQSTNRPILRKASSLAAPNFVDEIRWMKLRKIELHTADGLPALPMQISWVRDGILVIGMDSEMHVYSQWKPSFSITTDNQLQHQESEEVHDSRKLKDEQLLSLAQESSQRQLANVRSMTHLTRVSSILGTVADKKKRAGQAEPLSMDYMPDYGLFEASRIACPVLPQYHPKQLMELLNSGKIRWVKAILAHLVRCISNTCSNRQGSVMHASSTDEESICKQKGWSRSRALSVSYAPGGTTSPLEPRGSTTAIPEELMLDYAEITSIPPLPLWTLLAADKETPSTGKHTTEDSQNYNDLFDANLSMVDESLEDILEVEPNSPHRPDRRMSVSGERQGLSHFGPRQGRLLSRLLTHTHLPGLSSLDQMHLLALADTVSTCNTDFAERFAIDAAKTAIAKENLTGIPGEEPSTDSLDDCGLRFLMAMKHFSYLLKCLALNQRAQFQKQGVGMNNIVWAFHSESEEELLTLIPSYSKGTLRWNTLKELGAGWWMRNYTLLRTCVEKLAKAAYQLKEDPLDAALFYLAMKKKSLVWALFRSKRDEKMATFFSNNFSEDRWRKAALKNAFALLGKQRFEHAAAFFLLAGAIKDAIDVCLSKLEDFQLAMVIARLYEGELDQTPPSLKKLLYEEILGCNAEGEDYNPSRAHPDPFLRSMALWILKDYTGSLNTLLHTNIGSMHPQYIDEDKPDSAHANPNVFNFYVYLRTHPLLIRQYIASSAQDKNKGHSVVISGFSYGGSDSKSGKQDKQLLLEDSITPLERQLYFTTAHAHFKAGCPALALEVLSKLPNKVLDSNGDDSPNMLSSPIKVRKQDSQIDTGILGDQSGWGGSSSMDKKDEVFDWSQPASKPKEEELTFDWSQPTSRFEEEPLDLGFGKDDDEEDLDESDDEKKKKAEPKPSTTDTLEDEAERDQELNIPLDIMAQQLKFVACLKILMEELSTLATGFEVDGGQLRYQLYLWLEREVEALRQLCSYSAGENDIASADELLLEESKDVNYTTTPFKAGEKPTLHEILMAEKLDFEAKVQRAAKRKKWLKANETLLRTLLSYCSLHGASGGGLASVRMELVLLLQELQQEKTQQQLLSPLPFPTTLPLLSASVACNKTVVADPVRHLQAKTHDMLQTIIELRYPPMPTRIHFSEVFVLRDLSVALSACIYQSLCDSDTFSVKQQQEGIGMETLARLNVVTPSSHLIAGHGRRRRYSSDEPLQVTTHPSKWPGVTNLRALLAREKDEDTPKLNILLCEAFIATYMSLVVYAMSTCDCNILFRLVGQTFCNQTWASLYGGGVKKLLRVATSQPVSQQQSQGSIDKEAPPSTDTAGAMWNAVTNLTKQRVRLNMKLLGQFGSQSGAVPMKEDRPTYREQFVPPEMSMVSYFLIKPQSPVDADFIDYDSADSAESEMEEEEEDVFDDSTTGNEREDKDNTEHSNPNSYAWCVLRLAITTLVQHQLKDFLNVAGIELQELPVSSPLIHAVLRVVYHWVEVLKEDLESKGASPSDFIPGCFVDSNTTSGPAIHKYRSLLEKFNTPFHPKQPAAAPARRLWSFLVRQEEVQDIFIRAVFGKKRMMTQILSGEPMMRQEDGAPDFHHLALPEPVRIIHKDQDSISSFCLNEVANGLLALATPKELQEMDISLLLESPAWLEDECEFDIVNLSKEPELMPATSFLVIQTASDRPLLSQVSPNNTANNSSTYGSSPANQGGMAGQTGRGASVMKGLNFPGSHNPRFCQFVIDRSRHMLKPVNKHKIDGIRRMSAHPLMPVYLSGSQDGSVQMWEWGHTQPVATPRPPGTFAKVTRVRFSQHGNKFGVADGDGNVSLWQVGIASTVTRPFFNYQCHNKLTSDFVFLGSCSLLATAGHSSESKNVALWDSLLPQKKALVTSFTCHDQGATSIIYAPQHQAIISAGKKGDICIFDVRQRQLRQRFLGHESTVKCLALDPNEEFFVTGSADGDIKVWSMSTLQPYFMFPGEHARSSFFKNIGQGVTQLHIDSSSRLFSCGADGSMKVRQLPDRDLVVQSIY
ncbi:dmX-like protein 2 [Neocloeon triangulifer]|uniref:dmX-like protein 2 n=1 Tax=Neocloeon triangulifer TaxID=2078957 RepID=UPI00286EFC1B|nr:dmX-like protein 2 [Neocloeon triangulifer]